MLEGFFYGQKKLPIILFSYIVPIRKDKLLWHYLENILEKSLEYLAKI